MYNLKRPRVDCDIYLDKAFTVHLDDKLNGTDSDAAKLLSGQKSRDGDEDDDGGGGGGYDDNNDGEDGDGDSDDDDGDGGGDGGNDDDGDDDDFVDLLLKVVYL
ncbi:hypothetical protein Cadr_000017087 [Camelus dromedarius]|uniref:Uncharacterized protein n=1 Tax=Camelus dromedarius TaxID=9838 RepID=A0A5N4DFD2_CAMDR|nr:hypothetical protein Cadr_000017087 [Camelus dromedarius]